MNNTGDEFASRFSLVQRIVDNINPKQGFSFIVSGVGSRIFTRFNPPLQMREGGSYEMGLMNLRIYYSFPNFHAGNNSSRYSHKLCQLVSHCTEHRFLQHRRYQCLDRATTGTMQKAKITIDANTSTLRVTLKLPRNYHVVINVENSLRTVLDFKRRCIPSTGRRTATQKTNKS